MDVPATIPPLALKRLGGQGPDLLLIHGFGSDRLSWLANAPALEAEAVVWTLDLPGHGAAPPAVGDGRLATLAEAVEAAVAAAGLHHVVLAGHSLGGAIALLIAARRPDLVGGLVLIAPAGLGTGVDAGFLRAYPQLQTAADTQALLERLVVRPRLINRQLVALVQRQLAAPGVRDALTRVARGLSEAAPELEGAAADVAARDLPRLLVWGDQDGINPFDPGKAARFGGDLLRLPDTGHLPHVEEAGPVNGRIADFLRARRAP